MSALPQLSDNPSHEADVDVSTFVLDVVNRKVKGLDYHVEESITAGEVERTIEGASTLTVTVHDPKRVLLRSGMFAYAIDVRLDRLYWRLVQVKKSGPELTLTFEDREVAYLRRHKRPRKASRGKVTRAEFALSLVREVKAGGGIPFICPELHVRQPIGIENKRQRRTASGRSTNRQQGLSSGARLTVKGVTASLEQKRNMERVLDVADSLNAGPKATLALVEACIVEGQFRNLSGGDKDSRGILQVRDATARGMGISNRDIEQCVNAFLRRGFWGRGGAIQIAREHTNYTAGTVAQNTQGSAYPGRYDEARSEAIQIVEAYGGTAGEDGVADTRTTTRRKAYEFRRGTQDGKSEDSWTCLQRLAEEVQWRCFMSAGSLYFIAEDTLLKSKARFILTEETEGVLGIDFDVDNGKVTSEVTITARASRWVAAPGAVVVLHDCGPADGRWLVSSIRRGLFDAEATITLKRPTKRLAEPDDAGTTTGGGSGLGGSATTGRAVDRAYAAAKSIHSKRYPYVWGGGHASAGKPDGGTGRDPGIGFDCSGSSCAVLAGGGLGYQRGGKVDTSGTMARSWGEPGKGQYLTVYANDVHVFIVFHKGAGDATKDEHFGTGNWGKGWGGAGFNPQMHPLGGFSARHWPGT